MKKTLLLLLSYMLLSVLAWSQKYLPSEFSNIKFGMPIDKVLKKRNIDTSLEASSMDFRIVHIEEINRSGIKEAVYYFDNEGVKPFYEIIIVYENEMLRDKAASKTLGEKNFGDEWEFETKKYKIKAWTFQSKLIVTALIENTEWWEEFNEN